MKLSREAMLETLGTRDPANNGRFIIGVLSTGIYCLPSCPAKTPNPENVRFFRNSSAAESFGLRPCKRCKPDQWERGEDRELHDLEKLVAFVRAKPDKFATVTDLARTLDVGTTKLNDLFRTHYQTTPFDFLGHSKLDRAQRDLLETDHGVAEVALDAGFESLSVFNDNFKRRFCMTPSAYRQLRDCNRFEIQLPDGYCLGTFVQALGRDPDSSSERLSGDVGWIATPQGTLVKFRLGNIVTVECDSGGGREAFKVLYRLLGLGSDPSQFESYLSSVGRGKLLGERAGTRIPLTASVWDAVVWSVIGQQINLRFAFKIRKQLFERFGVPVGEGLYSVPSPEAIAQLKLGDLQEIQFSRQKESYLIHCAQLGSKWFDDLERMSFTSAKKLLLDQRGIGVWSANYILMRGLGFPDCLPLGDTGLRAGLAQFLGLEDRLVGPEIEEHMRAFAPFRSLATFHLWQSLK